MSTIDNQLAELLGKNADLFAAYENWSNGQVMLLAGTIDDPASFNAEGGKTGALGYYPVVNVSGQTIYVPCIERLRAIADSPDKFLDSPALVGAPTAPTPALDEVNPQRIANVAYIADLEAKRSIIEAGFEGVGDAVSPATNRTYLQQMIDYLGERKKGRILLPKTDPEAVIGVDRILYFQDNVSLHGAGRYATHIRNVSTASVFAGSTRLFDIGNRNQADMNAEPTQFLIEPIVAGAGRTAKLLAAADRQNFDVGDIVWAWTTEKWNNLHQAFQMNRVQSIAADGTILMEKPWMDDIGGAAPLLCKASLTLKDPSGRPRRTASRVEIKHLTASVAEMTAWVTSAGSTYEGLFEDMLWDSRAGLFYNTHAFCVYKDMELTFNDRLLECADASHDNIHMNIIGRYVERGGVHQGEPIISFNGHVKRNVLQHFQVYADDLPEHAGVHFGSCTDNIVSDGLVVARTLTGQAIRFNASIGKSKNNTVRDMVFYTKNLAQPILFNCNEVVEEDNNSAQNIEIIGAQAAQYGIVMQRANNPKVKNVRMEKGGLSIGSAVRLPQIDGVDAYGTRHQAVQRTSTRAVSGAAPNGSGAVRLTVAAHGLLNGEMVKVRGVGGVSAASGTWQIAVVDANTIDLIGSTFTGAYTSGGSAQWRSSGIVRDLRDLSALDLENCGDSEGSGTGVVQVTDAGNVVGSCGLPPDTLIARDEIEVDVRCNVTGVNGAKTVLLRLNGTVVATLAYAAADTGAGRLSAKMICDVPATTKFVEATVFRGSAVTTSRVSIAIDTNANPMQLDVVAYVANSSDVIRVDHIRFTPRRPGTVG